MMYPRSILILVTLMSLVGLPFVVVHPTGTASAGLSAGFLGIIENPLRLLLILPAGLLAGRLRGDERIVLPVTFLLLYLVGTALQMDLVLFPMLRLFVLGAILTFGLALSIAQTRIFLATAMLTSSIAYHLGGYGMQEMSPLASPLYYVLGQLLAIVLVLATSFAIGTLIFSEISRRADVSMRIRGLR